MNILHDATPEQLEKLRGRLAHRPAMDVQTFVTEAADALGYGKVDLRVGTEGQLTPEHAGILIQLYHQADCDSLGVIECTVRDCKVETNVTIGEWSDHIPAGKDVTAALASMAINEARMKESAEEKADPEDGDAAKPGRGAGGASAVATAGTFPWVLRESEGFQPTLPYSPLPAARMRVFDKLGVYVRGLCAKSQETSEDVPIHVVFCRP